MNLSQIVKAKKYPAFIKKAHASSNFKQEKWFEHMGLKNSSMPIPEKYHAKLNLGRGKFPRNFLIESIQNLEDSLAEAEMERSSSSKEDVLLKRKCAGLRYNLLHIIDGLSEQFTAKKKINQIDKPSISIGTNLLPHLLKITEDLLDNSVLIKDEAIEDSADELHFNTNIAAIQRATKRNYRVVFSAEGGKGAWDIATMSMRGIHSCMRWTNGNSLSLVGSISDPCCGVIYITDGSKTNYGEIMLARSVVRIVVGNNTKPMIFIDQVYLINEIDNNIDYDINDLFLSFFHKKLKKQYRNNVSIRNTLDNKILRVPKAKQTITRSSNFKSYMDSENGYTQTIYTPKDLFTKKAVTA